MRNLRNRAVVLVALTLGASACAVVLGIDDVTLDDAGVASADASSDATNDGSLGDAGNDAPVLRAYSLEVSADNPVGYFRLGDKSAVAVNAPNQDHDGTYGGTITHTDGGGLINDRSDNAAIFPGPPEDSGAQILGIAVTKDPIFETSGTLTIEVWVEPLAAVGDGRVGTMAAYGSPVSPFEAWALKSNSLKATFFTSCCSQVTTTTQLLPDTIYYLVATFDHGAKVIYVDGVIDAMENLGDAGLVFDASTDGLGIGSTWNGTDLFDGILDEVAVYDHVLPVDRILTHYAAGKR